MLNKGYAQKSFSGLIVDTNNQPVPYAHVQLTGSGIGTTSNHKGLFNLYLSDEYPATSIVKISSIGYLSKEIRLTKDFEKIILQEDIIELQEVAVIPKNYALEILEKAIQNIPINYPNIDEKHTGFYREKGYWDGEKEPAYLAEVVLESHKHSYNKPQKEGHVRLVKGRKFEGSSLDSLSIRFFGGAHDAHEWDIVARRSGLLANPRKYELEILDTLRVDSKDLYRIKFSRNEKVNGHIYVLDSTFAIVKVYVYSTDFNNLLYNRDRIFQKVTINYSQNQGFWKLNSTLFETAFNLKSKRFDLFSEYATTKIDEVTNDIPYIDRIQYGDVLLHKTGNYDSTFWKNYNIILPDPKTEELFKNQTSAENNPDEKETSKSKRLIEFLRRIRSSLALDYSVLTINQHNISYSNPKYSIDLSDERKGSQAYSISSAFQYKLKNSWFIGFNSNMTISNPSNVAMDLQLLKEINLNPTGRPFLLSPTINLGYQQLSQSLGNFKSESNYKINGKTFDSGSTDTFLQQRGLRFMPSISLGIEKSHRLQYFISAGYNIPINQKVGLYFDETDQFFLKQKSTFLKNGKEGLEIVTNGNAFENKWNFSAGLYLSF